MYPEMLQEAVSVVAQRRTYHKLELMNTLINSAIHAMNFWPKVFIVVELGLSSFLDLLSDLRRRQKPADLRRFLSRYYI